MTHGGVEPATERPAPSVRRCATAAERVKFRRAAKAPPALARHLVAHLSHPCAKCWQAVEKVGRVSNRDDPNGLPLAGVLESSPEAPEVEALVRPVLRVLDLLRQPSAKTRVALATAEESP